MILEEMRKRYLIVTMNLADLAAGIVFKRIVFSMKKYADCDVICPEIDEDSSKNLETIPCYSFRRLPYRIENWFYQHHGYRISESIWAEAVYFVTIRRVLRKGYDAIISFVYGSNFASIVLGKKLSKKTGLPWALYSVDAIPAPIAWSQDIGLRAKILKHLSNYYPFADAVFAANPVMLEYELSVFGGYKGYSGVVLTPCGEISSSNTRTTRQHSCIVFLYAGFLYGARKANTLLAGFELFLKNNPGAKLLFVGGNNDPVFDSFNFLIKSGAVELHPFTKAIDEFYNRADVLIDLNADIENDVFLSSKVCNYLTFDKPIVSISQEGSPVRLMMGGINSIVHSHHDAEEICFAMHKAVSLIGGSVEDRIKLRHQFHPDTVAKNFCEEIDFTIKRVNG